MTYKALGHRFEVEVDEHVHRVIRESIAWAFEGLLVPEDAGLASQYRLEKVGGDGTLAQIVRDGGVLRQRVLAKQVPGALMTLVNGAAIASRRDRFTVHAAAVVCRGRGVLLPAASASGKSTLAAALIRSGCDYLTDEAVAVDFDTLSMEDYPKPLSLAAPSLVALGVQAGRYGSIGLTPASWLRPAPYARPTEVRMLVFPAFEPGARPVLEPISRGEALVALANNSFNFVDHGGEWLAGIRDITAECTCWRLTFGHALDAARAVMSQIP